MSYYSDSPVPGASIQRFRFRTVLWSSSLEESALKVKYKIRLIHQRRSGYKLERDRARIAAACRLCLCRRVHGKVLPSNQQQQRLCIVNASLREKKCREEDAGKGGLVSHTSVGSHPPAFLTCIDSR